MRLVLDYGLLIVDIIDLKGLMLIRMTYFAVGHGSITHIIDYPILTDYLSIFPTAPFDIRIYFHAGSSSRL